MDSPHRSNDHTPERNSSWRERHRKRLQRFLEKCWQEARDDYEAAGRPLGPSERGFEVWVTYATNTTAN